jgi:putative PIN family toxin of toxin-antitoxin system
MVLDRMKAVLDTSVVVSAVRSRSGASNAVLELALSGSFEVMATPALLLEYEEVLFREEHRAVHGLADAQIEEFLRVLAAIMTPVRVHFQWRPQMLDADDEMVLETALNGSADRIVTHNIRDFQSAVSRFRLNVVTPASFLTEVRR